MTRCEVVYQRAPAQTTMVESRNFSEARAAALAASDDNQPKSDYLNKHDILKVDTSVPYKREIVWRNVISMILIHFVALYSYFTMALTREGNWYFILYSDAIGRLAGFRNGE